MLNAVRISAVKGSKEMSPSSRIGLLSLCMKEIYIGVLMLAHRPGYGSAAQEYMELSTQSPTLLEEARNTREHLKQTWAWKEINKIKCVDL